MKVKPLFYSIDGWLLNKLKKIVSTLPKLKTFKSKILTIGSHTKSLIWYYIAQLKCY